MPDIAIRIRESRLKEGRTQNWLAEKLGVSQTAVALWERGTRQPTAEIIEQIAELLNVTPSFLMGWDEQPKTASHMDYIDLFSGGSAFKTMAEEIMNEQQREEFNRRINEKLPKDFGMPKKTIEPTYEDIEQLIARNGKKISAEDRLKLIKLLSELE